MANRSIPTNWCGPLLLWLRGLAAEHRAAEATNATGSTQRWQAWMPAMAAGLMADPSGQEQRVDLLTDLAAEIPFEILLPSFL
jgi:hypothetical protein